MHRAVGIVAVGALALAGCKGKRSSDEGRVALAKMTELSEAMCACTDRTCVDSVQEALTRWSRLMAEASSGRRETRPDEALMKDMTVVGQKYAECMTRVMEAPTPTPPPTPTPTPEPDARADAPAVKRSAPADRPTIARLIGEAKELTRATEEHLAVHVLQLRHVASDGTLDPNHGELTIGFGNPQAPEPAAVVDDPDRPTGAPLPDPPAPAPSGDSWSNRTELSKCPVGTWSSKSGWSWSDRLCMGAFDLIPRCPIAEVWKRATAKQAPAKAVATLELVPDGNGAQVWTFAIVDDLRKVNIDLRIPDTCKTVVEKP